MSNWHGTVGGYTNHKCRCDDCKAANTVYLGEWRTQRLAERVNVQGRLVHPAPAHGTINGYSNYGCRCDPCADAHIDARRARRERKVAA